MRTTFRLMGIMTAWLAAAAVVTAQVPQMMNYQGRISNGKDPYDGTGYFKFALVDVTGAIWYWSNDGSGVVAPFLPEPANHVQLEVQKGLFSVMLGDPTPPPPPLVPMKQIPPYIFQLNSVYFRMWFSEVPAGPFKLVIAGERIVSVAYAMNAQTVADGAINEFKLAPDAVTSAAIKNGAVTSDKLADRISLESVNLYDETQDLVAMLQPRAGGLSGGELQLFQKDGIGVNLIGDEDGDNSGGAVKVNNRDAQWRVCLDGDSSSAGKISLRNDVGDETITLNGGGPFYDGPKLTIDQMNGEPAVQIGTTYGSTGGFIHVQNADGEERVSIDGDSSGRGKISIRNDDGDDSITLSGAGGIGGLSAEIIVHGGNQDAVGLYGSGIGGAILVNKEDGTAGVYMRGDSGGAGYLRIDGTNGNSVIILDGVDSDGNGRITAQVLEITGGSDLSENFDITGQDDVEPGMVLCVDPANPGNLVLSSRAYDRNAAGVVSGAGGVKPGMLMGQAGSIANGKHPVALTGRVYCQADTSNGAIQPGDLLTTSDLPGHAMKVTDHARAQGAIIGKAMTALSEGNGLVLVLVSLQ